MFLVGTCSGWHADIMRTPARTEETPVAAVRKTNTFEYGYCYSAAATASKAYGVLQAHSSSSSSSSSRQHSKNEKWQ